MKHRLTLRANVTEILELICRLAACLEFSDYPGKIARVVNPTMMRLCWEMHPYIGVQ